MTRSARFFPYLQHTPVCAEAPVADASVAIIGRTTLGKGARFGSLATLRADGHHITVGDDFWMGARSTIHIAHEVLPAVVGHGVTVGYNTTVHACTVGNGCVIEDNVVILDGAVVGDNCVVAAGSVVFPRAQLPAGHYCEGSPAKPVRELTPEQVKAARERLRGLSLPARVLPPAGLPPRLGSSNFIAPTSVLEGRISLAPDASIWYACELRAGEHEISVGEGTNVQDNTVILANHGPVRIGAGVTVGHNVLIQTADIGHKALIGIGSVLGAGTVVEDDVLLAAGSVTLPGQRLTAGSMWAGRPARKLGPLDDAKRHIITYGAKHYVDYNHDYLGTSQHR
ncbi:MAG: gamma carbonic anhydrase family protein [Betaproteobacteria bacterium]|nr:gamma carbonic anhydrase family protein [Betaproteobacteria bacterium]